MWIILLQFTNSFIAGVYYSVSTRESGTSILSNSKLEENLNCIYNQASISDTLMIRQSPSGKSNFFEKSKSS